MFVTLERRRRLASRFLAAGLVPILSLVAAAYDPTLVPAAAASSCVDGWQAMPATGVVAPSPGGGASLNGQPAWWVGRSTRKAPQILRWVGGAWRLATTPWTREGSLAAVSAASSTSAWAVGYLHGLSPRPISAHWDGSAWRAVAVTNPGGQTILNDVVALPGGGVFAVGAQLTKAHLKPFAIRWSGTGWRNISPTLSSTQESGLVAVAATPAGAVYAAGWRSDGGRPQPWIGAWNGSSWQAQTLPAVDGTGFVREIAFASPTDGWAAGYAQHPDGTYGPLLYHWDGASWSPTDAPWAQDSSVVLMAVTVSREGVVTLAGNQMGDRGPQAVVATFDGLSWHATTPLTDPYPGSWIEDAQPVTGGAWIAAARTATRQMPYSVGWKSCTGSTTTTAGLLPTGTVSTTASTDDSASDSASIADSPLKLSSLATVSPSVVGVTARDVTYAAGLGFSTRAFTGLVADFNNDTWPDIFINRHMDAPPMLELGGPSGFTLASTPSMEPGDYFYCSAADANNDGQLDLFCPAGRRRGNGIGADELWQDVNDNGGTVATTAYSLLDISGRGRSSTFVHLASDPLPDLFVGKWAVRMDGLPSWNRFYRNVDGTHFAPDPTAGMDGALGATYAMAADLNGDGNDEILLTSLQASGTLLAGARVFVYNGASFVDQTQALGIKPMHDKRIKVADFNGDGKPDIAQLATNHLRVSVQQADGHFARSYDLVLSGAMAMDVGDVNGDGLADIYVRGNRSQLMLVNNGSGNSFTSIALPPIRRGGAADVVALDYDKNGLTDFLSLNGAYSPGPLQLIAFSPAP